VILLWRNSCREWSRVGPIVAFVVGLEKMFVLHGVIPTPRQGLVGRRKGRSKAAAGRAGFPMAGQLGLKKVEMNCKHQNQI